ncbi:MAG: hypothetical protein AAFN77_16770 [Planctomycetota bacterium]
MKFTTRNVLTALFFFGVFLAYAGNHWRGQHRVTTFLGATEECSGSSGGYDWFGVLPALDLVQIRGKSVKNIEFLGFINSLKTVHLCEIPGTIDLSPLVSNSGIRCLRIEHCTPESLDPLLRLPALEKLILNYDLSDEDLQELTMLSSSTSLHVPKDVRDRLLERLPNPPFTVHEYKVVQFD